MMRTKRRWRIVAATALTVAMIGVGAVPVTAQATIDGVADGFIGPLGLAVGQDGTVYVAEAFAGRLTALDKHGGRESIHSVDGFLPGVATVGKGNVVFTATLETGPPEAPVVEDTLLGRITAAGDASTLTSLQDHEEAHNPDGDQVYGFLELADDCRAQLPGFLQDTYTGIVESNPYKVAVDAGSYLVADAAGNTIVRVAANGRKVETVAVLPPVPQVITQEIVDELAEFGLELPECTIGETYTGEPVPTDIEVGPDGHYYVSSLPGIPEAPGAGSVWRIDRTTGDLTMIADGFTGATDIAIATDGAIYVAELFADQISVIRDGVVSPVAEVPMPGAIEIARDGTIYATVGVFFPTGGSLVTVTP